MKLSHFTPLLLLVSLSFNIVVSGQTNVTTVEDCSLTLWYDQPADQWMTEALPIGNGPMGAMLSGTDGAVGFIFKSVSFSYAQRRGFFILRTCGQLADENNNKNHQTV